MPKMNLHESCEERRFIASLDHGADLLNSIRKAAEERGIKAGVFWIIGAVKDATVAYYNQKDKKYVKTVLNDAFEITSCLGNISEFKGQTRVHAHITLADKNGRILGGHACEGTTIYAAELYLVDLKVKLERAHDNATGLDLF